MIAKTVYVFARETGKKIGQNIGNNLDYNYLIH
jgi:hypothetical protein